MAEVGGERAQLLRAQYHGQTARIRWHELQAAFARGSVIGVAADSGKLLWRYDALASRRPNIATCLW